MADGVFNITKGAVAEMFRISGGDGLLMLLESAEVDATLVDYDDIAALLVPVGNVEAAFTNYARKTGITGTITVDDTNDRVDIDMPDQTWTAAGNGSNETLEKAIFAFEDAAADATRRPCTHQGFAVTTDGSNLTIELNAAGFYRAA